MFQIMPYKSTFLTTIILFIFCTSCKKELVDQAIYDLVKTAESDLGMVVSAHPLASEVGADIIAKGGTAADAAIATQLALAVVYPRAGNIGGGGFMVYREGNGAVTALDYREKAPAAAHKDMYLDEDGNIIKDLSTKGHLASGVPGTVAGLYATHDKYGRLGFNKLIEPAIQLAENGFKLTKNEAKRLNELKEVFVELNGEDFPFVKASPWKAGDLLIQKALANTLRQIKTKGPNGFYGGQTADYIVEEMQSGNGIITKEDLSSYEASWRTPIHVKYRDYDIYSMSPPSSGGVALGQLTKLLEPMELSQYGFQSVESIHRIVEAERRVYADRAEHLGDSDFYDVPIDLLLDEAYLEERINDFSADSASSSASIVAGDFAMAKESFETTHLSVMDGEGNAASVTTTINASYGSKVWVKGAGFFLNNEMDDFSSKPGTPNMFGLIGAEANKIEAGKRMLSSMTPTIIEKNNQLFMVLGTPGGSTIITSVLQVFLNVVEYGMNISEAVAAKRFHHQWLPDQIMYEKEGNFDADKIKILESMGHKLRAVDHIGTVEAIMVVNDTMIVGAADPRRDDHAAAVRE